MHFGPGTIYLNKGEERSPCFLHPNSMGIGSQQPRKIKSGRIVHCLKRKICKTGGAFQFLETGFLFSGLLCFQYGIPSQNSRYTHSNVRFKKKDMYQHSENWFRKISGRENKV